MVKELERLAYGGVSLQCRDSFGGGRIKAWKILLLLGVVTLVAAGLYGALLIRQLSARCRAEGCSLP